jgi:hypothetical protein
MNYIGEVTNLVSSRCETPKIFEAMDYVIIAEWEKQEIPLVVVGAAINQVCDKLGVKDIRIESISCFDETVKQSFRAWLQSDSEIT